MSNHTPGPWVVTHEGGGSFYIRDNQHQQLYWMGNSSRFDAGENEANARLIAAAPDLLEALKDALPIADEVLDEFESSHSGPCGPEAGCDGLCVDRHYLASCVGKIRAAIAKAEKGVNS